MEEWNDNGVRDLFTKDNYIDIPKTVNQIDLFDGKSKKYGLIFDKNYALTTSYVCHKKKNETSSITTQALVSRRKVGKKH